MNLDQRLLREARTAGLWLALTVGLGFLAGVATVLQALYLSRVTTQVFLEGRSLEQLWGLLLLLLAAVVFRAALVGVREVTANQAAGRIKAALRERLFARLLALGPAFSSGERTGELANTLMEGVEALEGYFSRYLPSLALAALVPITILAFVFPLDLLSGLVFLLTAPLIPLFTILIGRMAEALTHRQWETLSHLSAHFLDVLQGLTTLKLFGRSRAELEILGQVGDRFRTTTLGVLRVAFLSALALELLSTLSTAIVAVEVGLRLLYGTLSFEQALFVLILAPEFYLPLRNLGTGFHAGISGVAAARRIFEILETPDGETGRQGDREAEDAEKVGVRAVWLATRKPSPSLRSASPRGRGVTAAPTSFDPAIPVSPRPRVPASHTPPYVRFEAVDLAYDGGERPALRGVTFEIARGERVALVGPSGAGKSSVAHLLLEFLRPDRGRILVEGRPLGDLEPEEWRRQLAWVPQNPYLFHATVADNLRVACPEAPRERLIQAAQLAGAHDFILGLPRGYDTAIGERGERLSGGQAQRLALARAFLKDAPFLILDEAASHLDPEQEALIQETLERLMEGRTVLAIAHRLGAARRANRVLVLEEGRLVEAGSHPELLRREGLYRRLVEAYGEDEIGSNGGESRHFDATGSALTPTLSQGERELHPLLPRRSDAEQLNARDTAVRLLRLVAPFKGWMALSALLGFATVGSAVGLMATAAFLIAGAALHPSVADLAVAIVGVRFFGLARGLFRYLERYVSHDVTFRLLARLRVCFYQALEPRPPAWMMQQRAGDLLNRIVAEVESLQHFYVRVLAPPVVALLIGVVMVLFLSAFDASLAWILAVFLLLSGVALPLLTLLGSHGLGREATRLRGELNVQLVDGLQGMAELLAFGQGPQQMERARELGRRWMAAQARMAGITGLHSGLSSLLSNLGMWTVLAAAIPLVAGGKLEGVYLPVVTLAALASFEAVAPLPAAFQQMGSSLEAARRLFEIADGEPGTTDGETGRVGDGAKTEVGRGPVPRRPANGCRPGRGTRSLLPAQSSVLSPRSPNPRPPAPSLVVEDLRFRYAPDEPAVLDGVSFRLPEGRSLALVGPSGAGKSTLIGLLLRFWDYQEGQITLGGRDLRSYDREELLRGIGVVAQRTHLFDGTLRENLLIARPEATDEQIDRAVQQAQLDPFVKSLPRGYETAIGELGLRLSGGERQRLAIARALLKDAPLLILDEPTANLDSLTEREVMGALRALMASRTTLVVTHRPTGLEAVDQVLVMRDARVVDRGRHGELLARKGPYRRVWGM